MRKITDRAIFCPRCNSTNIHPYAGGITGSYFCKDCGYLGTLIVEKDFVKTMKGARVQKK